MASRSIDGVAGNAVGVDLGATLTKLAISDAGGGLRFEVFPTAALADVAQRIESLSPESIGLAGGGAPVLAKRLSHSTLITEFDAWSRGAVRLLPEGDVPEPPFMVVSIGTGTSALLVERDQTRRVGGTALGGGTVVGLSSLLLGTRDFAELCALAAAGRHERVNLLVGDVYSDGHLPLPAIATAALFGKLASDEFPAPSREDLAAGLMHMLGETVALMSSAIAGGFGVTRILYGGSTLRGNKALADVVTVMSLAVGRKPTILEDGQFAGALGALIEASEP